MKAFNYLLYGTNTQGESDLPSANKHFSDILKMLEAPPLLQYDKYNWRFLL
jgi:hypothetical protein